MVQLWCLYSVRKFRQLLFLVNKVYAIGLWTCLITELMQRRWVIRSNLDKRILQLEQNNYAAEAAFSGWTAASSHPRMAVLSSKDGLLQEGHFATRKQPRCQITMENEAKKKISLMWGGGPRWWPKPSPHPQWRLLVQSQSEPIESGGFSKSACETGRKKSTFGMRRAVTWLCPKLANFTPIPKLMIFARNFFNKIDAWTLYLGDASVKNHLPLPGVSLI